MIHLFCPSYAPNYSWPIFLMAIIPKLLDSSKTFLNTVVVTNVLPTRCYQEIISLFIEFILHQGTKFTIKAAILQKQKIN